MKTTHARIVTYSMVGLLAIGAFRFSSPLPDRTAVGTLEPVAALSPWRESHDTLGSGETLSVRLARRGVGGVHATQALLAANQIDMRRVPAGMPVTLRVLPLDTVPSEIILQLAIDRLLHLRRTESGWTSEEERLPWVTDTLFATGTITSSLYAALDESVALLPIGARSELAWTMADILEYRVDMSRDLREGDSFRVLFERSSGPNGAVRIDNVLAASFVFSGVTTEAIRFESESVSGDYFDQDGKSLRAAFLRAPLEFRRISSVFGRRKHPVLGTWRAHKGTDYAANSGTPVRTVGEGVVIFAGRRGGYGNTVEIRHPNGYVTRYAHLRGFAKGAGRGARVVIGKTVGYVGSTGLTTGPHLHFEVLVKGVQRDPRSALRNKGGKPIPEAERDAFVLQRSRMLALLDATPDSMHLAAR